MRGAEQRHSGRRPWQGWVSIWAMEVLAMDAALYERDVQCCLNGGRVVGGGRPARILEHGEDATLKGD